jgi:hypothetical protein
MIGQIRHLQNKEPFESFALELSSGRIIQIYDAHQVATACGSHHSESVIGILHGGGRFEVISSSQVVSVSVGVHPKVKEELDQRMERAKKIVGQAEEKTS